MDRRQVIVLALIAVMCAVSLACSEKADADSDKVKGFAGFPLVWVGEEYDSNADGSGDMPVSEAKEFITAAGRFAPETHGFDIIYGDCTIPPGQEEGGCPLPVQITVYPACQTPELAEEAKGKKVKVRGVDAVVTIGGAIWIETEDFTVQIWHAVKGVSDHEKEALKIAEKLEGANDKAKHIKKDSPFKVKAQDFCEKEKAKTQEAAP